MSLLNLEEIGQDADLLTCSDNWLEEERQRLSEELRQTTEGLRAVLLAQKIKKRLQQKNLVAVQQLLRDASGNIKQVLIRIMNLPDALSILDASDTLGELNAAAQLHGWCQDGYDIKGSAALRQ